MSRSKRKSDHFPPCGTLEKTSLSVDLVPLVTTCKDLFHRWDLISSIARFFIPWALRRFFILAHPASVKSTSNVGCNQNTLFPSFQTILYCKCKSHTIIGGSTVGNEAKLPVWYEFPCPRHELRFDGVFENCREIVDYSDRSVLGWIWFWASFVYWCDSLNFPFGDISCFLHNEPELFGYSWFENFSTFLSWESDCQIHLLTCWDPVSWVNSAQFFFEFWKPREESCD